MIALSGRDGLRTLLISRAIPAGAFELLAGVTLPDRCSEGTD